MMRLHSRADADPPRNHSGPSLGRRNVILVTFQANERDRRTAREDRVRRPRILGDVELCVWRDISLHIHCPTHDHDLLDLRCELRKTLQGRGDIGQRPKRDDGRPTGRLRYQMMDEAWRVRPVRLRSRPQQIHAQTAPVREHGTHG